ncbi:Lysophospholipase L1 [Sinosporangium album]|uniref:Lysophospholipase L1 n=1 Tax=Sinosporangium album TaxID=504805 RepID=A0A1G7R8E2_9ACTN|nr:SGNH/GDSL hydrolase family protein [Sinosporangium album]SDG07007.1 Lysophospholipase L1 [Sinosporangium album]
MTSYGSFAAIGDSFTEGLSDEGPDGAYRGWADRVADHLASLTPGFRYANLAVRGKLLDQVVDDQVPLAVEMRPDLVSLCAGNNDLLRPGSDPDAMAGRLARAIRDLRATGADVVLFTGVDPRDSPLLGRARGKFATYYLHIRSLADLYGCRLVDLWSMQGLRDWRAWNADRLHLNEVGHRLVAAKVLAALGVPDGGEWRMTWPHAAPVTPAARRADDARWAREHLLPWVGRRLRGTSSGDGLPPKRPHLTEWP